MTLPAPFDVLGAGRMKRPYHRYRYALLMAITRQRRARLLAHIDAIPEWRQLFSKDGSLLFVLFRRYLDRRWSMGRRFDMLEADLGAAARHFRADAMRILANRQNMHICAGPGYSIDLGINRPTRIEGMWAFSLNDAENRPLFNLSFGFTGPDSVLIASMQGVKRSDGDTMGLIRQLTKGCHGLRPHSLLLEVFRMACACWGIRRIEGIDSRHQVTRYKKKEDEFKFDYRAYWIEHGAHQGLDGNWLRPVEARCRTPDEMPGHKRAMYRKRYALLDGIAAQTAEALQAATLAPDHVLRGIRL